MRSIKSLLMVLCCALLVACGALPGNPQGYAGINYIKVAWADPGGGDPHPKYVKVVNGKEQSAVDLKFQMPDGTILNYAANDVKAFAGQDIRGRVEQAVAEQLGVVSPGVIDAIMAAVGVDPPAD